MAKTIEGNLFGFGSTDENPLLLVRAGSDASVALDNASTFMDAAIRGLEGYIMRQDQAETADSETGSLWSLTYTLRMAKGLVDSTCSGILQERHEKKALQPSPGLKN